MSGGQTMDARELEERAKELYESGCTPRPRWSQLGEVTKSVWREYVLEGQVPERPQDRVAPNAGDHPESPSDTAAETIVPLPPAEPLQPAGTLAPGQGSLF